VKYSVKDARLGIEFVSQKDFVAMKVSMASLQITDEDYENMFEEGYSGYWAKAQALDGNGIGMYYIKRLMNLNKGEFIIERGKNNFLVDGIPYSTNIFTFLFMKDKGD
jgi:signal transduction histidine kinase